MNPPEPEFVELKPDSLFGTDGYVIYPDYCTEFSGRFDAAGQPVFVQGIISRQMPYARPHRGQCFQCAWLPPDRPGEVIVRTTSDLRLVLSCPDLRIKRASLPAEDGLPSLTVEAQPFLDERREKKIRWEIYQRFFDDDYGVSDMRLLTPELEAPCVPDLSEDSGRRVKLATAIDYVAEEMRWLKAQRDDIRPDPDFRLTWDAALFQASREVLGEKYRLTLLHQRIPMGLLLPLVRQLGTYYEPSPDRLRMPSAKSSGQPDAEWSEGLGPMLEAARHPVLIRAVADKAKELYFMDRKLTIRLSDLEQFHGNLLARSIGMHKPTPSQFGATSTNDPFHDSRPHPFPAVWTAPAPTPRTHRPANRMRIRF